jgi:hypothetical protein
MRFLYVCSSAGSLTLSVGATTPSDIPGFSVFIIESTESKLRFRSVKLGAVEVVAVKVGEIDANTKDAVAAEENEPMYVIIGSDDGYTEVTLLRIAAVINEMCIFLSIGPTMKANQFVLKMVLHYIHQRMEAFDLSFLSEATESVFSFAITATGFSSNGKGLLDELARQSLLEDVQDDDWCPSYALVLFGHKTLLETTPALAEEAARRNNVDKMTLNDADRYLIHLLTSAFFSVPMICSSQPSQLETRIRHLEHVLSKLDINRNNVTRASARRLVEEYMRMLRDTKGGSKPNESQTADLYGRCFFELLGYCAGDLGRFGSIPAEYDPRLRQHTTSGGGGGSAAATFVTADHANLYHHPDVDFDYLRNNVTVIEHLAFRSSDYNVGKIQLCWIDLVEPVESEDYEDEEEDAEEGEKKANDEGSSSRMFVGGAKKIKAKADVEEAEIAAACPKGYGIAVTYFPPKTDKCYDKLEDRLGRLVAHQPLTNFSRDVHGSMELSFNQFQWLLSPPVESYETPGLIHFIAVDRKDNTSVCGSFERMRHQRGPEVRLAVRELQRIMAQCISRSHELLCQGFSEGLWGHLGMQFFYSVGTVSSQAPSGPGGAGGGPGQGAGASGSAAGKPDRQAPGGGGSGAGGSSAGAPSSPNQATPGLFGSSDAKKIPSTVLEHLVLRPMLLPDVLADDKQLRIGEIYCLFVGCMSAQEVCSSVEWLRNSRLFH